MGEKAVILKKNFFDSICVYIYKLTSRKEFILFALSHKYVILVDKNYTAKYDFSAIWREFSNAYIFFSLQRFSPYSSYFILVIVGCVCLIYEIKKGSDTARPCEFESELRASRGGKRAERVSDSWWDG